MKVKVDGISVPVDNINCYSYDGVGANNVQGYSYFYNLSNYMTNLRQVE